MEPTQLKHPDYRYIWMVGQNISAIKTHQPHPSLPCVSVGEFCQALSHYFDNEALVQETLHHIMTTTRESVTAIQISDAYGGRDVLLTESDQYVFLQRIQLYVFSHLSLFSQSKSKTPGEELDQERPTLKPKKTTKRVTFLAISTTEEASKDTPPQPVIQGLREILLQNMEFHEGLQHKFVCRWQNVSSPDELSRTQRQEFLAQQEALEENHCQIIRLRSTLRAIS